ncbi:MAG: CorA family divalent cation transporter, partial [Actinomycetes bacterium]
MAVTRLYRHGVLADEGFPVAQVSERLEEEGSVVLVDLCAPDAATLSLVASELGLHDLAVEDAVHEHQRAKLDRYATHSFLNAYAVRLDPAGSGELQSSEVSAFITGSALVVVRKDDTFDITTVLARVGLSVARFRLGVARVGLSVVGGRVADAVQVQLGRLGPGPAAQAPADGGSRHSERSGDLSPRVSLVGHGVGPTTPRAVQLHRSPHGRDQPGGAALIGHAAQTADVLGADPEHGGHLHPGDTRPGKGHDGQVAQPPVALAV